MKSHCVRDVERKREKKTNADREKKTERERDQVTDIWRQ
jgi:hypothetical protein